MKNFWKKFLIWSLVIDGSFVLGAWITKVSIAYSTYVIHVIGNNNAIENNVYQNLVKQGEKYGKWINKLTV